MPYIEPHHALGLALPAEVSVNSYTKYLSCNKYEDTVIDVSGLVDLLFISSFSY